ncbi:hypothetical protein KCU89_g9371, partial [Aureobasidium melanogenum]
MHGQLISGRRIALRGQNLRSLRPATSVTRPSSFLSPNPQRAAFSTTLRLMTAQKIDGTAIAKSIRERINQEITEKQAANPRYKPSLKIVQVGERSDSSTYVRMKLKAATEANIECDLEKYPEDISESEL